MSLDRAFLCMVFIIAFVSCKHETKAIFPEEIPNEINQYINRHKYTTVIYIEPTQCTSCALSNLASWKTQKKTLDKYDIGILLVFNSQDETKIIEILRSLRIVFMFIFDKTGQFKLDNSTNLAEDNVFVIDKDKNLIFNGSPIKSEKKWNTFVKRVKR